MPVNWNPETELKLCVTILDSVDAKPDWAKITTAMNAAHGDGFTKESVRQRFAKILKGASNGVNSPSTLTSTDTPTKAAKTPKNPKAAKGAKAEANGSPAKGRKRKGGVDGDGEGKAGKKVKMEAEEDRSEDVGGEGMMEGVDENGQEV